MKDSDLSQPPGQSGTFLWAPALALGIFAALSLLIIGKTSSASATMGILVLAANLAFGR